MSEEIKPVVNPETPDVEKVEQEPVQEESSVTEQIAAAVETAQEKVQEAMEEVKQDAVNLGEKTLAELSDLFQTLKDSADRMKRSKEAEAIK